METKDKKDVIANEVSNTKVRPKTISVTAGMIREIAQNPKLGELMADQINNSDGNLKGTMAYNIAKALLRQTELPIK